MATTKQKIIHVCEDAFGGKFLVKKVINTTQFLPGAILTKSILDGLCVMEDWRVVIEPRS